MNTTDIPYGGDIDQKTFDAMINLINSGKYYPYILKAHNEQIEKVIEDNEKKKRKKSVNNSDLLKELMFRQLKNIPVEKKLQYQDLKRICKYINLSIFDEKNCCEWNGYITNANKSDKGTYVNFYFRKKKAALHRLLYINFIGELSDDEYLKFNCENKGVCCNIKHIKKFRYAKKESDNFDDAAKKCDSRKKKDAMIAPSESDLDICFD
jgi:hypothetical protein